MLEEIARKIEEINILYQFCMIFIIGLIPFLEAHVAVPVGVLLKLPLIPTALLGIVANIISVMLVIVFTNFAKTKLTKNNKTNVNGRFQKAQLYFNRYGVPGLSLMGPIVGANHISAFVSVAAGARKESVIVWQIISIILWGIGSGLLIYYGVDIYQWIKG
ncbi:small multi-drug export protein [Priestia filamentosa]|uniref:small multi-drug export protein n=1 Tax=Priestia filamentosa TaxID=1402861 RepID=UPI001FB22A84|nr:small multi-drug export protein [Priestia filamentosa]UOE62947.1 small multi-drug export protein [Priestia filamentosa]